MILVFFVQLSIFLNTSCYLNIIVQFRWLSSVRNFFRNSTQLYQIRNKTETGGIFHFQFQRKCIYLLFSYSNVIDYMR